VALLSGAVAQFERAAMPQEAAKSGLATGQLYLEQRQPARAVAWLDRSLREFQRLGDRTGQGTALSDLGTAHVQLGSDSARAYFERSLVVWRDMADSAGVGACQGE
jgi:plasmid stabilization system protein ParE